MHVHLACDCVAKAPLTVVNLTANVQTLVPVHVLVVQSLPSKPTSMPRTQDWVLHKAARMSQTNKCRCR